MAAGDLAAGPLARLGVDPRDPDAVLQAVRFELYRENIYGALEMVEAAHAAHPSPRYTEQAASAPGSPTWPAARPTSAPRTSSTGACAGAWASS